MIKSVELLKNLANKNFEVAAYYREKAKQLKEESDTYYEKARIEHEIGEERNSMSKILKNELERNLHV